MSESPTPTPRPDRATKLAIWTTIGDTTWRMLVPSALLVAVGIYADLNVGTSPWMTILGVILGLGVSALLIKHQIGSIK